MIRGPTMLRCAVAILALTGSALTAPAAWQGTCTAEFDTKVTVDGFVGKATSQPFTVADDASEVVIMVRIADMQTGKAKRDEDMQHMFRADRYPVLSGAASAAAVRALAADAATAQQLPLRLTIGDVTQDLTALVTGVKDDAGRRTFDAAFDVSLKASGLKAPSIMGMIRVHDIVKVTAHVALATAP